MKKAFFFTLSALLILSCGQPQEEIIDMDQAIGSYVAGNIGSLYSPGDYCIPYAIEVATEDSNPADILVWADFRLDNFVLAQDTLKCVSGGSHPGLMHLVKSEAGYEVTGFDAVADGASFGPTAKAIFGNNYDALIATLSNDSLRKASREEAIANYVSLHQIPAKYYQDYGWDALEIPVESKNIVSE